MENDVFLYVEGEHVDGKVGFNEPAKAMATCKFDSEKFCSQSKLNINHGFYPAEYNVDGGDVEVCIGGRSNNLYLKEVCLSFI